MANHRGVQIAPLCVPLGLRHTFETPNGVNDGGCTMLTYCRRSFDRGGVVQCAFNQATFRNQYHHLSLLTEPYLLSNSIYVRLMPLIPASDRSVAAAH